MYKAKMRKENYTPVSEKDLYFECGPYRPRHCRDIIIDDEHITVMENGIEYIPVWLYGPFPSAEQKRDRKRKKKRI